MLIFQTTGPNVEPSYTFPCKHNYIFFNFVWLVGWVGCFCKKKQKSDQNHSSYDFTKIQENGA